MTKLSDLVRGEDFDSVLIESASDQDYLITLKRPVSVAYKEIRGVCSSGTCTAQLKLNGSLVAGTSLSVTTTQATATFSQAIAVGDKVEITISSNSSAEDVEVILMY